jgi:hypothetical protein
VLEQTPGIAAAGEVAGEQVGGDDGPGGEHHAALDHVFQLADVAGPVVIEQRAHGVGRERAQRQLVLLRHSA